MLGLDRLKRRSLEDADVNAILKRTPVFEKGSKKFFRKLDIDGLVSYTEYLFLLCILTSIFKINWAQNEYSFKIIFVLEPEEGFRIAFNMFDTDGNRRVDKKEFLVVSFLL